MDPLLATPTATVSVHEGEKQTEAASALDEILHHLQEQLQLNLLRQSHLIHQEVVQNKDGKSEQLGEEQRSLMLQIQWIQQQLAMVQQSERGLLLSPSLPPSLIRSPRTLLQSNLSPDSIIFYESGMCKWTGCETPCPDLIAFLRHISTEHTLDDKSTAQARVQMQIISQLELQLQKEKDKLQYMMNHLGRDQAKTIPNLPPPPPLLAIPRSIRMAHLSSLKYDRMAIGEGIDEKATRRLMDAETAEIVQNKDFYRVNDVRPPFTYASLIRQAILDSKERQLTLNDIYNWFQNTFAYFRHNAATWKNAIRTNLSLHKCFVRFEDDFGSYWTVDDGEFLKRRHLTRGRPRKYNAQQQQAQQQQQMEHNKDQLTLGLQEGSLSPLTPLNHDKDCNN